VYMRIVDRHMRESNDCSRMSRRAVTGAEAVRPDIGNKGRKRSPK
jgi:hypothetical protein